MIPPPQSSRAIPPQGRKPQRGLLPVLAALLLMGLWVAGLPGATARAELSPTLPKAQVLLSGETFRVDVVELPEDQAMGLGRRRALGPHEGMLFVYAQRQHLTFWMKRMLIPLDMLWLDDQQIVHIERDVPPPQPGTPDAALPTYTSPVPANFVLEIAAGRAAALHLREGDWVRIQFPSR